MKLATWNIRDFGAKSKESTIKSLIKKEILNLVGWWLKNISKSPRSVGHSQVLWGDISSNGWCAPKLKESVLIQKLGFK